MQQFTYTVTDPLGMHARPAGELAKLAKSYPDTLITISKQGTTVKSTQLLKLMSLGIKAGDEIQISAEGGEEGQALQELQAFCMEKL